LSFSWLMLNLFNSFKAACKAAGIFDRTSDTSCNVYHFLKQLLSHCQLPLMDLMSILCPLVNCTILTIVQSCTVLSFHLLCWHWTILWFTALSAWYLLLDIHLGYAASSHFPHSTKIVFKNFRATFLGAVLQEVFHWFLGYLGLLVSRTT
jgi:hypothetical protein